MENKEIMANLAARFEPGQHGQKVKGGKTLTFVGIDPTINRLNDVLGERWSLRVKQSTMTVIGDKFLASLTAELTIFFPEGSVTRDGVGADFHKDPDKATKTALAQALKKAANLFGLGLYLWDEEERAEIEEQMGQPSKHNTATQKGEVDYEEELNELKNKLWFKFADDVGHEPDGIDDLMAYTGLSSEQLNDVETLRGVLGA